MNTKQNDGQKTESKQKRQCAQHHCNESHCTGLCQSLTKKQAGKENRKQNTAFINRGNSTGRTALQRFIKTQPRSTGGDTGQTNKT